MQNRHLLHTTVICTLASQSALFSAMLHNEHALVVTRFRSRCQELDYPLQPAFFKAEHDTHIAIQLEASFGAQVSNLVHKKILVEYLDFL